MTTIALKRSIMTNASANHRPITSLLATGLVALFAADGLALDRADVRTYIPFDGAIEPRLSIGPVKIQFEKGDRNDIEFTDGRRGRAVLLKEGFAFNYSSKQFFAEREGTLSFWVRPVGWQRHDGKYHWFVNLFSPTTSHQFYKYGAGGQVIMYVTGKGRAPTTLGQNHTWDEFRQDRWTHFALTFKPGEQVFYIDGQPMQKRVGAELTEPIFDSGPGTISLHEGHPANAIDELMTFGRALTETEVRALYGATLETPLVTAAKLSKPPSIDGTTDEDEWAGATRFVGWLDSVLGVASNSRTEVAVGRQKGRLFVRFRRPIPEIFRQQKDVFVGSPLRSEVKENDQPLRDDDHVAVHIQSPSGDRYVFAVNGDGTQYDAKNSAASWNGSWNVSQRWDDHFWIVEFLIPLAEFAEDFDEAEWGINFLESHRQIRQEDTAWAVGPGEASYGKLCLSNDRLRLAIEELGDIADGQVALRGQVFNGTERTVKAGYSTAVKTARAPTKTSSHHEGPPAKWNAAPTELLVKRRSNQPFDMNFAVSDALFGELGIAVAADDATVYRWHAPFVFSPQQRVEAHYLPSRRILRAIVDAGSSSALKGVRRIHVRVARKDAGGAVPMHSTVIEPVNAVREVVEVDCADLPLGEYALTAHFESDDAVVDVASAFEIERDPEWLGNTLGKGDDVPAPWRPIERIENVVKVLDRDYSLGTTGLPAQISIGGKDQLRRPAKMTVAVNGGKTQTVAGEIHFHKENDAVVHFEANAMVDGVVLTTSGSIAFDGFVSTTTRASSTEGARLDQLTIEFPIRRAHATLWTPPEYVARKVGKAPDQRLSGPPLEGLRIGDAERGLQFSHISAVRQDLVPEEDTYTVRYDFVATPVPLNKTGQTYDFAWQALPVKPRSDLFRRVHIDDALWTTREKVPFKITPVYTEGWCRHWNYHNFWNREVFEPEFIETIKKNVRQRWEREQLAFCMYLNITTFDRNTPEYRKYRFEWVGDDAEYMPPDPSRRDEVKQTMINSHSSSFLDFYMWHIDKTVRYLTNDGEFPIHCYLDNTVANREYMMRLYRIVKSINPMNQIIAHMSGDNAMWAYGFADWLVEGEENTAYYLNRIASEPELPKDYTQILDLDKVRARYSPHAFGDKMFLYQFWGWKNSEPTREHLWGLLAVHDGTTWAAGGPGRFKKELQEFGWDDRVQFLPYWRTDTGVRLDAGREHVVASAWTRGDRQLMVLVVNDSTETAKTKLQVDIARFGFESGATVVRQSPIGGLNGQPDGETIEQDYGGGITLQVPARSLQLIRFVARDK